MKSCTNSEADAHAYIQYLSYMSRKPAKYGLKLETLVDAQSYYILCVSLQTEKD